MNSFLPTLVAALVAVALCPRGVAAEAAEGLQQPDVSTANYDCCEPTCGSEPNCAAEPSCCCEPSCGCKAGSSCGKDCCGCCRDYCVATVEKEKVEKHCWCTETKKICVPKVVCPWSKGGSGLTLFSFLKKRGGVLWRRVLLRCQRVWQRWLRQERLLWQWRRLHEAALRKSDLRPRSQEEDLRVREVRLQVGNPSPACLLWTRMRWTSFLRTGLLQ